MNQGIGAPVTNSPISKYKSTNIFTEKNPILYKFRECTGCFSPAKLEAQETEDKVKLSYKSHMHTGDDLGGLLFLLGFVVFFRLVVEGFLMFEELYLAEQLPEFSPETCEC